MTAGNQPTVASVNSQAGAMAVSLRTLMQQIQNFEAWLSAYGGATALTALGFTSGDAATIVSTIGNLNTLASIYAGTATQPAVFNYEANSNALWGGQ
jgi:multidrug resistance efflux pump